MPNLLLAGAGQPPRKPRACPRCWGRMTIPYRTDPWACHDEQCKWSDFTPSGVRGDWPFMSA